MQRVRRDEMGSDGRTRVDDTDPRISFAPSNSPFVTESSVWTIPKSPLAYNGSFVASDADDAKLSFPFSGDTLHVGMLHTAAGISARLTLENGTSLPLSITPQEAAASLPGNSTTAFQRKVLRFSDLGCSNHTATITPEPNTLAPIYFDFYSYKPPGPNGCSPPAPTAGGRGSVDEHTMLHAGIGAMAAITCVAVGVLVYFWTKRRKKPKVDEVDRMYKPRRAQTSVETMAMPLAGAYYGNKLSVEHEEYRPRGLHTLPVPATESGRSSTYTEEEAFNIGQTLLGLDHEASSHLDCKPGQENATTSALLSSHADGEEKSAATAPQSVRRPCTASAVDRLCSDARELAVTRALSPFQRRLPTAPAVPVAGRFRRNSTASVETHWTSASLDESRLDTTGMTIEHERGRVLSNATLPRRPPKSPHRPTTGTNPPPPLSYLPFTL
ncbi:hypothetical protein PaG_01340 [Moesziomyces aphidis]|uniref:Uncharacterized protein n=1 Tax=Moesziomyces aphidis TaxID=84754 RepID=W3VRI2_MOEAP|nr:hypothetical protein PaG_01340 [Moesziomyces aphidis]